MVDVYVPPPSPVLDSQRTSIRYNMGNGRRGGVIGIQFPGYLPPFHHLDYLGQIFEFNNRLKS
jgi:hypothetical protein